MSDLPETSCTCAAQLVHAHEKFQVNRTKIKGDCQSETKASQQHSCNDLTLEHMQKKFQVNPTKIKGGCQSETKAAHQHSSIDLTLLD